MYSSASRRIRVLIADDHLVFRMGLKALLATEPDMEIVAEAASAKQTVEGFFEAHPDVVVLDLRMPGEGGLAALKTIRARSKQAKILILSSYGYEEEVYQALNAGACGYLLKDAGRNELTQAIREIAFGGKCIHPAFKTIMIERKGRPELTPRELEVLKLLVSGLINREIATVLGVSENTVRNHTISIFNKLEVSDRAEAVSAALQRGIIISNSEALESGNLH